MKLTIGHMDYSVLTMADSDDERANAFGWCSSEDRKIRIDADQPPLRQLETLLHEVLHAALFEYGLRHMPEEERIVLALGGALAGIIRNNKNFLPVLAALRAGASFQGAK